MHTWSSHSSEDTYFIGKWIGERVQVGDIILLYGDMGRGKTVLARGIAHGAGFSGDVTSPTFTLMNAYMGKFPIYHFDLYRLYEPEELYDLDYEEYFYGHGITIVEWSERLGSLIPPEHLKIVLRNGQGEDSRDIILEAFGSYVAQWEEVLSSYEGTGN